MTTLSRVGEIVRRDDPDRFYTSLFAPAAKRDVLWILYAFNIELARACEMTREPMMALIRLQWWREIVEGAHRRHEVAEPLSRALEAGAISRADLLALIEGREAETPATEEAWTEYVEGTAGALATAAGRALGAEDLAPITNAGAAYGAAGVLRNRALRGEPPLPPLLSAGRAWLEEARRRPIVRPALAAALPAVFAARDLSRQKPVSSRGIGDKLAVMRAAVAGMI